MIFLFFRTKNINDHLKKFSALWKRKPSHSTFILGRISLSYSIQIMTNLGVDTLTTSARKIQLERPNVVTQQGCNNNLFRFLANSVVEFQKHQTLTR